LIADVDTSVTRGSTLDNKANLAANTVKQLYDRYGGTRLGRQELEGEILGDIPGALWNRESHRRSRIHDVPRRLERVYVAVDPALATMRVRMSMELLSSVWQETKTATHEVMF
jgi:phage terminase large subunit-like protein